MGQLRYIPVPFLIVFTGPLADLIVYACHHVGTWTRFQFEICRSQAVTPRPLRSHSSPFFHDRQITQKILLDNERA